MLFDGAILWVCTENGIGRLDTSSGELKTYFQADGLPGYVARMALVDGDHVWFAMKGGVARIDKNTNEITSCTTSDELLSDEFKDIEILGDNIYSASNKGVNYRNRFNKKGKWKKITTKQGLLGTPAREGMGSEATH